MTDEPICLRTYNNYAGPEPIGDLFTLRHGKHTMRCALSTHRLGWELRLTVGNELMRSQVCKRQSEVLDTFEAWEKEANEKGWS